MDKRVWAIGAALAVMSGSVAHAGPAGDLLRDHLYAGTLEEGLSAVSADAAAGDTEAAFAAGVFNFGLGIEGLAQDFYRYGATTPDTSFAAMLFGMGASQDGVPANPNPEPLTYEALRTVLDDFVISMDAAKAMFEVAGAEGDYVIMLDPLKFRLDLDGDGDADDEESVGAMLQPLGELVDMPEPDAPMGGKSKKHAPEPVDARVGLDRADAYWLAGYSQVIASQADFLLAHDFEEFFNAYLHRVFPKSGLPMQDFSRWGTLLMDPETDTAIADVIAAIHTADFPVQDPARLKGVLARLHSVIAFSRLNWEAILAETDDERELVPSPSQTSMIPETDVTQKKVDAWMATLDTAEQILNGELLIPHWRFKQGFDLKAFFETATETDVVMLIAGYGALPFLRDGPIADADSFADANAVFGDQFINYTLWFN